MRKALPPGRKFKRPLQKDSSNSGLIHEKMMMYKINGKGMFLMLKIKAVIGKRAGIIIVTNSNPNFGTGLKENVKTSLTGSDKYLDAMKNTKTIDK